ncbi:MAG: S8 family peptidase, partial [Limnobacter sp.]|nr:S8 family peptidase [Limnobacter sp.]
HGSAPTVVAVLDTGVLLNHPMLQGHLVQGYDFVSGAFSGNDGQSTGGNDRDADPSDPGDGTSFADVAAGFCSVASPSSWHGTFVSGLIAGNPVASQGVFSVGYNTSILPVRVLGRCGGFSTDLADGIRWAAGLPVSGVPTNANPAKVINLSLGAQGACVGQIEGAAVNAARNAGAVVIAAVGNDGSTVDTPANCPGVIGVSATDQEGLKANYSNFGGGTDISAPGGDSAFPLWSASNTGTADPAANTYRNKIGSSFSSALVSGAAGTVLAVNPGLSVSEVENALVANTRPFLTLNGRPTCQPGLNQTACNCTASTCGVGMLDAGKAVAAVAPNPVVNLFSSSGNVAPEGSSITFNGSASDNSALVFELGSIMKSDGAANPTLSVSNNEATVSLPAGVDSFLLRASSGGSSAIAAVSPSDQGLIFPPLLFGLVDTTGNATSTDLGSTGPQVEGGGDDSSSPQNNGGATGG